MAAAASGPQQLLAFGNIVFKILCKTNLFFKVNWTFQGHLNLWYIYSIYPVQAKSDKSDKSIHFHHHVWSATREWKRYLLLELDGYLKKKIIKLKYNRALPLWAERRGWDHEVIIFTTQVGFVPLGGSAPVTNKLCS